MLNEATAVRRSDVVLRSVVGLGITALQALIHTVPLYLVREAAVLLVQDPQHTTGIRTRLEQRRMRHTWERGAHTCCASPPCHNQIGQRRSPRSRCRQYSLPQDLHPQRQRAQCTDRQRVQRC